jgi:hypothetical protein
MFNLNLSYVLICVFNTEKFFILMWEVSVVICYGMATDSRNSLFRIRSVTPLRHNKQLCNSE